MTKLFGFLERHTAHIIYFDRATLNLHSFSAFIADTKQFQICMHAMDGKQELTGRPVTLDAFILTCSWDQAEF